MIGNLNHVGVSVIDLEKTVQFYTEVMGMEIEYYTYHKGVEISEVVNVDDAELKICVVKKGSHRIELLDYGKKRRNEIGYPDQTIPGLIHISFVVTDIDHEYERIKSIGYEFNSPPTVTRQNGPKICYFKGPDNVIIELYEEKL